MARFALLCLALCLASVALVSAAAHTDRHVLLISVDGLHGVDLRKYIQQHPQSTFAALAKRGTVYGNAYTTSPSDSFPGMLAQVTGATSKYTGVYYDDSYSRVLSPPGDNTCKKIGTEVLYDESIEYNDAKLNGAGGIDPAKLPRDPSKGCKPVYPHSFLKVNTIFEVAKKHGYFTAWTDKHFAYDLLNGPSGKGIDDLYTPEIAAVNNTDVAAIEGYDTLHANAIKGWIAGKNSKTGKKQPIPGIFGGNFQSVSVAQKVYGYLNGGANPTPQLEGAFNFIDKALGSFVASLKKAGIYSKTTIIVSAKHGQSPINPHKLNRVGADVGAFISSVVPSEPAHVIADDVALVWLNKNSNANKIIAALLAPKAKKEFAISRIIHGKELVSMFEDPEHDDRVPDFIVLVKPGTIYTTGKKVEEHGGFQETDTHVGLLVSNPASKARYHQPRVETRQIAKTILAILGLPSNGLKGANEQGTKALP